MTESARLPPEELTTAAQVAASLATPDVPPQRTPPEPEWTEPSPLPPSFLASFDDLLRKPDNVIRRAYAAERRLEAKRLLLGAFLILAVYGLAAGCFQGGLQIVFAGLKAPVILVTALALCLPSLYVFSSLAGADLTRGRFWTGAGGFLGLAALLMLALLPVNWLFSVSSRSLWFVVMMHMTIWAIAFSFAYRFLKRAFFPKGGAAALSMWALMFLGVAFQMTTVLRPVLWRAPTEGVVATNRETFLEHWGEAMTADTERP